MTIFYVTLISTYILNFLAKIAYEKKYRYFAVLFSALVALILIFVSGMRNTIGDTEMYMHSYRLLVENPIMPSDGKDLGFTMLSLLLVQISTDPQILIFTTALITNLFNVIMFNKYRSALELQVYMYITSGYYFTTMNGIRQCLAAALLFASTKFIIDGKFFKYCICAILISNLHSSAIMMIPLYFVVRQEAWSKRMIIFIGIAVVAVLGYDIVSPIIFKALQGTSYSEYSDFAEGGSSVMRTIVNAVPVALAYLKRDELKEDWPESNVFVNMSIINVIFVAFGMFNWIFNRFTLYTQLYNFVLVPFVISKCFKGREKRVIYFGFLICYFIFMYYEQVMGMGLTYHSKYTLNQILY